MGRPVNQRVARLTEHLDDHKLLLGLLVAAVGAFLGYIGFVSTTGPPFQSRYEIRVEVPADAPTMREGQEVRIAGRLAGLISSVEPDREKDGAIVTANITKPEFRPLHEDARANVRVHSIVYRTYLELFPGVAEEELDSGETIEQTRVTSGVDLLEVVQLFDDRAREALRDTVVNLGFGLAGRGEELNAAALELRPLSVNLRRQLAALTRERGALGRVVSGAARTADALRGARPDDVAALIRSGAEVLGTIGARPNELAETLRLLRPFEDELLATAPAADPLLADLAATAPELEPAVAGLNAALPDINRLLSLGGALELETARIAAVARPLLRTTRPLVRDIYPTVAGLVPLIPDVDRVVETITPYAPDIARAGRGLAEATSVQYPFGHGTGVGAPAGRVLTVLTCHNNRNPFPEPGESREDSAPC